MKNKWVILAIGILVAAVGVLVLRFQSTPSSTLEFSDKATQNLAELVKERDVDAPPPNIIVLLADDLGWADVGYRGSDIKTPNIDQMAKEGMRLERFYATPFCSPTRAALMTGRDPIKLGVAHAVLMAWDNGGVSLDEHFMPESFKAAGYQTAMIGKWHLGHTVEQHTPNARGFDHFYGHFNTDVSYFDHDFANGHDLQENGVSVDRFGEYATDIHGEQAVRYLKEIRDPAKPFFLYVPFLAPHSPMQAKPEDIAKYGNRIDLPHLPKKTYAAMVDSMDQAIGQIVDALEQEGLTDNTLILFFTDNGGYRNFGGDNAPLNGGKLTPYEGGVRVNAVLKWPTVIPADTVNESMISVLDVFPSLAQAAQIPTLEDKKLDGFSRWDAVLGSGSSRRNAPLFFTSNIPIYNKFSYAVLDDEWKLIEHVDHLRRETKVFHELYNIWVDPNEESDVAKDHPDQVERLKKLLDARLAQHPVGGTYVKIQPHPGWRAPKDYADVVIPADQVHAEQWSGFSPLANTVLQKSYGDKGKIRYE